MLLLIFALIVLFSIKVLYYIKSKYFSLDGSLPGMSPQLLFGNVLQTGILWGDETLPTVFRQFQEKFGDVFQFWLGSVRIIVVCCLEDVQHIFTHRHIYEQGGTFINKYCLINPNALICLTGEKFKRHSHVLSSLFRRNKINGYLETIVKYTDQLLARWDIDNNSPNNIHFDMVQQTQQLLIDIFGMIGFGYNFHTLDDKNDHCTNELARALHIYIQTTVMFAQLPEIIGSIYLFFNLRYRLARRIIDQYLNQIIDEELKKTSVTEVESNRRKSFIESLVFSLCATESLEKTNSEENKKGLSRTEIQEEMLSFLTASYGTVSTVLSWFIHLMSKHPRVQLKIKKELAEHNIEEISIEKLDSLIYLDCVLRELFRFAPPLHSSLRTVMIDDQLPASGIHLKKGEQIFISIYNLGRDKRYWTGEIDPDQFYPERFFIEDQYTNDKRAASIPFGGGHRQCIGKDLARFQLKVICARLMQRVTFVDGGPQINSGGYEQTDTIIPKKMAVTITFDPKQTFID